MVSRKLSRRDFLRMTSVAAAGTVISACAPATPAAAPATSTAMPIPPTYTPQPMPATATATSAAAAASNTPAAAAATATTAPTATASAAAAGAKNAWGVALPADAAALDQQFIRILALEGTTLDFAVSVYKRTGPANCSLLSTPLFQI